MMIELAPLLVALPALLVSNVTTILQKDKLEMTAISLLSVNLLQSMCLASFTIFLILVISKWLHVNDTDHTKQSSNARDQLVRYNNDIFHFFVEVWFPLLCVFTANEYLGPIRVVSLIFILQLLGKTCNLASHRSLQMENIYNVSNDNHFVIIFRKFQTYIILAVSFALNTCVDLFFAKDDIYLHMVGFTFISIPFVGMFVRSFTSKVESEHDHDSAHVSNRTNNTETNIKIHFVVMVLSFVLLLLLFFDKFSIQLFFVSLGSITILILSQLENTKNGKFRVETFLDDIIDYDIVIGHYKIYYLILNLVVVTILFLNNIVNPNVTFDIALQTLIESDLLSLVINMILLFIISFDSAATSKCSHTEKVIPNTKTESSNTVFNLFVQLINSEESKSIFNFLLLNVAFMFIQLLYSFRSKSLSLLSDSLHMLLDCISLLLGLMASIISKNNAKYPNAKYPFGLSRIGTLSGFTNGSLLLGIVFGIFNESIQRFFNPVELENTTELLIVSTLGFLVNLVGIFAFNHGHDHSHGHSHGHGDSHKNNLCANTQTGSASEKGHLPTTHDHESVHTHEHAENGHTHSTEELSCTDHHDDNKELVHEHTHDKLTGKDCAVELHLGHLTESAPCEGSLEDEDCHGHGDDNMHGIFLHIMADTLGSVGVILSTIVVKVTGWSFVDPLASIMIATLILLSSIPLLKSSSSNLLLSLNDKTEEELKYLLSEVLKIPGVKSYTTPRFWPQDGPNSKLVGYLHVQYFRTENSLTIRTKIDRLFTKSSIINMFYLQLENEVDECWCRKEGIFSTF